MAGVAATVNTDSARSIPVVLRVKRKRTGDDPADALVVASKARKIEEEKEDDNIFHFCGSVGTDKHNEKTIWDLLDKYGERKSQVKSNPLAKLSISDSKKQSRDAKKQSSVASRYEILSSLRSLKDDQHLDELHLYDILDKGGDKMEEEENNFVATSDNNTITCNSTVLVREKIPIEDSDYVYDIYMTHCNNMEDLSLFDWNTLSNYCYEPELVHDIFESDEDVYEDEDDSNDEDNWRNDYPDEEESDRSSNSSVDSPNNDYYRHREPYFDEQDMYSHDYYYEEDSGGRYNDDSLEDDDH